MVFEANKNRVGRIVEKHKAGSSIGIPSLCSANPYVIKAALLKAKNTGNDALIESTSNQVDQFGGYTGMTPADFIRMIKCLAEQINFDEKKIIYGGDHLGPNVWQNRKAEEAMKNAVDQIDAYVTAGYTKIHLDASMKCADDGDPHIPLEFEKVAERSASLCKAAEEAFRKMSGSAEAPVYIIGTDVPPPGGAKEDEDSVRITPAQEVEEVIRKTKEAFFKNNLQDAWERVIAVVVQPGVEFGDAKVFDYSRAKSQQLIKKIESYDNLIYEAHSTDYQTKESLKRMVEDHFGILKVGPWLTFAFREAVFALAQMEEELLGKQKGTELSNIRTLVENRMVQEDKYWKKYYRGTEEEIAYARKYSYSDRIRYYWTDDAVQISLKKLIANLSAYKLPPTLISQYMPEEYDSLREGEITNDPEVLIISKILKIINIYNFAANGVN